MEDRWLSGDEIATYLGVKRDTVYGWISNKNLPAHRVGRLWKFKRVAKSLKGNQPCCGLSALISKQARTRGSEANSRQALSRAGESARQGRRHPEGDRAVTGCGDGEAEGVFGGAWV